MLSGNCSDTGHSGIGPTFVLLLDLGHHFVDFNTVGLTILKIMPIFAIATFFKRFEEK